MENLLIGLIISATTGITFIAYKHPKLFIDELLQIIINTLFFAIMGTIIYDYGASSAHHELMPFTKVEKLVEIGQAVDKITFGFYGIGSGSAAVLYILFLNWLSSHMISQTSDPDETVPTNDQD